MPETAGWGQLMFYYLPFCVHMPPDNSGDLCATFHNVKGCTILANSFYSHHVFST